MPPAKDADWIIKSEDLKNLENGRVNGGKRILPKIALYK